MAVSFMNECKKGQNTQVMYKNLHISGPLFLYLAVLSPSYFKKLSAIYSTISPVCFKCTYLF